MSKYISQINNTNFVYPNYDLAEYDVDIVHNINNNSVSGYVTTLSATTVASTGITVSVNYTWVKNNADIFIRNINSVQLISLHAMVPNQNYYKPFRIISNSSTSNLNVTTQTVSGNQFFSPATMGVASFISGTYYFEVRFIGATSIFPVCRTLSITIP